MRILLIWLFYSLLSVNSISQEASHYSYEGDDLSSNIIYYLYKKDGKIYAATDNGVTIISNGKNVVLRNDSARSNSLTLIHENSQQELFVMNFKSQIFKIKDNKLELFADLNSHFETRMKSYFFYGDYLYANSSNRLKRFSLAGLEEDQSFSKKYKHLPYFTEANTYNDSVVIGVIVVKEDTVYTSDYLKSFFKENVRSGEAYLSPIISEETVQYFTRDGQLVDYSKKRSVEYTNDKSITEINYFGEFEDLLWVTTNSGVVLVEKNNYASTYHWLKGIPCSYVLKDYQGNIWVGTIGEGIKVFPEKKSNYIKVDGDYVFASILKNGDLYYGTKGGRVWKNDQVKWNLRDKIIDLFVVDSTIYIQTADSLFHFANESLSAQKSKGYYNHGFTHNHITFLASSSTLLKIDSIEERYQSKQLDNIGDYVVKNAFFQKVFYNYSDNSYYGLNVNEERITSLSTSNDVFDATNKAFHDIVYDYNAPTSSIYVVYNLSKVGKLDFDHKQINNTYDFRYIVPKKCAVSGNLLIGYENGLLEAFDQSSGKSVIYDKLVFQFYEELVDLHVDDHYVYVVFSDGVHKIPLDLLFDSSSPSFIMPPTLSKPNKNKFAYRQNERIVINLNYFDELNKSKTIIKYKLNENSWVEKELVDQLEFEQLSHGDYVLTVEFRKYGRLIERQKTTFSVSPYWYQTNLFRLFFILVLALLLWLVYRMRINYMQKRHEEKSKLIKAQLSAINAQMKPHFVFNTLNSIQNTILQGDKFLATQRLSEFAGFVRKTLDFSRQEKITLREELEMIQTYIKFEEYRFRDKFTFEVNLDLSDQILETVIPPFIIQPYVENAIIHGVSDLREEGKVIMEIRYDHNLIICSIIDNGIGIEASKKKNVKEQKHHSFATEANFNRIELLKGGDVKTQSSEKGTTVTITFRI